MGEKRILLTGGAGYIGTAIGFHLTRLGWEVIAVDNFSTSRKEKKLPFRVVEADLAENDTLEKHFSKTSFSAVIHLAAFALVSESIEQPEKYFRNNILSAIQVGEFARNKKIKGLIHSSSCAVYGNAVQTPIGENHPQAPISPYGESKVMAEKVLESILKGSDTNLIQLRYFNPCGSTCDGTYGESHDPETHLLPRLVSALLSGDPFKIYGDDYATPDGTCIRDLVHIDDIAEAHILAVEKALTPSRNPSIQLNLGSGKGTSVRTLIQTAETLMGAKAKVVVETRRPADPPILFADITSAKLNLGWSPKRNLEDMINSHCLWVRKSKGIPA